MSTIFNNVTVEEVLTAENIDVNSINVQTITVNNQDLVADVSNKVDKITGKGLSTNDYTNNDKYALDVGTSIINLTAMSGVATGGNITLTGGINFSISSGSGYVRNSSNNIVTITWSNLSGTVPVAGDNFIYLDYNGDIVYRTLKNDNDNIFIGYITTNDTNSQVLGFSNNKFLYNQYFSNLNKFIENSIGTLVEYGFEVSSQPFPNTLGVSVTAGALWEDFNQFNINSLSTFRKFYRDSTGTYFEDTSNPNNISNSQYNDISLTGSNALLPLNTGYYKKDLLFISTKGNLFYQYGTTQYSDLDAAFNAEPPHVNPASTNVSVIAHIIVQEGNPSPIAIIDMRASFERLWNGHYFKELIPTIPHHQLHGLLDDDHTQYHNDSRGDARYYRKTELDSGSLDTRYYTESEINTLLLGKSNTGHTHVSADITDLSPTTVGLGNVPNIDATNASNISSGTLANARLTANLNSIGNIVKSNGDIIAVVGGVYSARTISQYKTDLSLNNVPNVDTSNASNISSGTLDNSRLSPNLSEIGNLSFTDGDIIQYHVSGLTNVSPTHLKSDLLLTKSDVGLSNVQNVDQTNASNITSGTLSNSRLSANLTQIGNLTLSNGDFFQFNGAVVTNVTPAVLKSSLSLAKGDVGLGNVQNVDQTNASNITSGTLSNNRLSTNLGQIGGITFATNDIIYYNGTSLSNITPTSYKSLLSLTKSDVGLSNVTNSLQVINAGGTISIGSGANLSKPAAGTSGRFYKATDNGITYYDNGTTWAAQVPAYTGDATSSIGDTTLTLASVNSNIGSFGSTTVVPVITVNAKGLVTAVSTANLTSSSVGLGNVQNVDQTNANNITSGTLSNSRLSTNIAQLGDITFSANNYIQYNGTTLTNVTPAQVKSSLSLTKSDVGLSNVANVDTTNASNITTGTLPLSVIPAGALERLAIVADQSARFALTTATVQNGDTVKQNDTGVMYFVVDDTNLGNSSGYQTYTAGAATTVPYSGVTSIPVNITQIANASFTTNDIPYYNGSIITNISPTSYKNLLSLTKSDVGLSNVTNSLQVINAGNGVSFASGNTASRPSAGTNGRLYASTDSGVFLDNGTSWVVQQPAISGDITISANSTTATLATVNSNIGTFNNVTVNAKGLVTAASNVSYLTANQSITLSGDFTGTGTTAITGTLATVNSNTGSFGNSNTVPVITVNGKGLITAVSTSTITPTSIGLGNVTNSLQVINAGNGVSLAAGTNAAKPVAATNGRFYNSTDQGLIYFDNGTSWIAQVPAYTGDVTSSIGGTALTLATVNSNIGTFNNVTVNAKGLVTAASNVSYLTTNQSITLSGDITGSGTTAITGTLATVNGNVGTFGSTTVVPVVTVNAKGLVTAVSSATLNSSSVGLGNVSNSLQVINAGGAVSYGLGTNASKPAAGTAGRQYYSTDLGITYYDNGSVWTAKLPAYTGDVTSSVGGTALTLATVNSNIGTFNNVTVNAKGLVTAASNISYLTANQSITLSGDFTGSGTTAITGTLATVNSNIGSFGNTNTVPVITVNGKGLITAVSTATITPTSIGLGNVTNSLQVINAGGLVSIGAGSNASKPLFGTVGRQYYSTDQGITYYDTGASWVAELPAYAGDATSSQGGTTLTLATVNSNIGTFNNVTVNAKGLVTAASNANYLDDPANNGILVRTSLNTTGWRAIDVVANQISITNPDGVSGNPTIGIANNPIIPGTASMTIPSGTTAQRDTPTNGQMRYNTTLGIAEMSNAGVYRPFGKVAQFITGNIAQTTGTTILPYDATLPTSTEGFQIWTASITPYYANSTIIIMYNIFYECSANNVVVTTTLLNDTTAIAASSSRQATSGQPDTVNVTKAFTSGTTSTITLSARIGPAAASTVYVNRGNTETFGGTIATSYIIMEVY